MSERMRMDAYYFAFGTTGVEALDKVLSAVACAGKAHHHTEDWQEETGAWEPHTGRSPVDWIFNAASEAAATLAAEKARADRLEADCAAMRTVFARSVAAFRNGGGLGHIAAEMARALERGEGDAGKRLLEEHVAALAAKDAEIAALRQRVEEAKHILAHETREDCCTRQALDGPVYCEKCQAMNALDGEP